MITHIIAAGHKIVNGRVIINLFCDAIEWHNLEEKDMEMIVHVDWIEKIIVEDNKLEFHPESLTFIDCKGV